MMRPFGGEIVEFAETVLFKIPASHTGQVTTNVRQFKADSSWGRGVWVGRTEESNEHIVLTE